MRWPRSSDSSRRSPRPGSSQRETSWARSGRCFRNHSQAPREVRQLLQQLRLERLDGEERNQPDHRAHLERDRPAVGQVQLVVVELVLLVPQADAVLAAADVGHRLGDVQEVLEELGGDVLVDRVVQRQLQGDAHQVEAVHRHPAGAVGLVR